MRDWSGKKEGEQLASAGRSMEGEKKKKKKKGREEKEKKEKKEEKKEKEVVWSLKNLKSTTRTWISAGENSEWYI